LFLPYLGSRHQPAAKLVKIVFVNLVQTTGCNAANRLSPRRYVAGLDFGSSSLCNGPPRRDRLVAPVSSIGANGDALTNVLQIRRSKRSYNRKLNGLRPSSIDSAAAAI